MNLVKIGEIETPYQSLDECPSNVSSSGPECKLHIEESYRSALLGLKEKQKILVLYWLDQAQRDVLVQSNVHRNDGKEMGTFALRSPFRPNPIGASEVIIESLNEGVITVRGLDCLSGTALIDIKPS